MPCCFLISAVTSDSSPFNSLDVRSSALCAHIPRAFPPPSASPSRLWEFPSFGLPQITLSETARESGLCLFAYFPLTWITAQKLYSETHERHKQADTNPLPIFHGSKSYEPGIL